MADQKISQLSSATLPLAGTESVPIVQSGVTVKTPVTSFVNGRAITPTQVTVDGNFVLSGGLGSDVGILKNTGQGYGVATDRWIGSDGTTSTWFYNVPTGGKHYFAVNQSNKLGVDGDNVHIYLGNLVQGTAAKGVNFTANTPAAGMTSQLLNWYEEGNWTPNQGAGLTVVGAFSSGGKYVRVGKTVTVNFYVSGATSVTAAAGDFITTNLPFATSGAGAVGIATNASPSVTVAVLLPASTTNVISAGAIGATATIYVSATYSV